VTRNITQEGGVVTSLHLTPKYIIVALDNAKIHVFDTEGNAQRTLQGHVMGVWAMAPWEDLLVSGGCDRDVRVWDLSTGYGWPTIIPSYAVPVLSRADGSSFLTAYASIPFVATPRPCAV